MQLRDLVVEEVALVDKAANKRKFILRKRRNTMDWIKIMAELEKAFPPISILDQFKAKLKDDETKISEEAAALLDALDKYLKGFVAGKYPAPGTSTPAAPAAKSTETKTEESETEKKAKAEAEAKEKAEKDKGTADAEKAVMEKLSTAMGDLAKAVEKLPTKEDMESMVSS